MAPNFVGHREKTVNYFANWPVIGAIRSSSSSTDSSSTSASFPSPY
jgi:hypothetical protein